MLLLEKLVTYPWQRKRSGSFTTNTKIMSGNGSDFENDGDFMQEPSAKKSKLEEVVEEHGEVLQLHTDWDHRDTAVRHDTCE